ncbi:MAG: amidohydrolase [Rhodospirillaceae bacterium]|nr:MAG: amidohydrolase [Rhodospirillaceae bacterium]
MDFRIFDADQHYYEREDCFTRYAGKRMVAEKAVRWVTEADGKRRRLLVGGQAFTTIGNPTFNPITKPGAFHETLKNLSAGIDRGADAYGELTPIDPAYRERDVRLATMDAQDVERVMLFPTLGVTMEGYLDHDVELLYEAFHAFNRWLQDDWGFAYKDRIYGVPYIPLLDRDRAVAELEWLLQGGARVITLRPGAAYGHSPADPYFDSFWARINEAGVLVTYHAFDGPSLASRAFRQQWAAPPQRLRLEDVILERAIATGDTAIMDTLTALILHNLFGRFPKIRVATIELGSSWVPPLLHRLDHVGGGGMTSRRITAFGETLKIRPSEFFRQNIWVSPWPEENVPKLAELVGVDHVLMGSDWPHAEGIPQPRDYAGALAGLDQKNVQRIMRDNALELVGT